MNLFLYFSYIFFYFVGFYTGIVQLFSAGLPLTSCFGSLGHLLCRGPSQCPIFRWCLQWDSNPVRPNLNKKYQCLNDVGYPDPQILRSFKIKQEAVTHLVPRFYLGVYRYTSGQDTCIRQNFDLLTMYGCIHVL